VHNTRDKNLPKQVKTSLSLDPALWKETRRASIDREVSLSDAVEAGLRMWIGGKEESVMDGLTAVDRGLIQRVAKWPAVGPMRAASESR
jgi:hypothetical protein